MCHCYGVLSCFLLVNHPTLPSIGFGFEDGLKSGIWARDCDFLTTFSLLFFHSYILAYFSVWTPCSISHLHNSVWGKQSPLDLPLTFLVITEIVLQLSITTWPPFLWGLIIFMDINEPLPLKYFPRGILLTPIKQRQFQLSVFED